MDWFAPALALYAGALLFGAMVFFSAVIAPTAFQALPAEMAARFVRALFPRYYVFILLMGLTAAIGLVGTGQPAHLAAIALAIGLSAAWLRWSLMPQINAFRDRELAGDESAAAGFALRHRISVVANMIQLVLAGYLLAWLV